MKASLALGFVLLTVSAGLAAPAKPLGFGLCYHPPGPQCAPSLDETSRATMLADLTGMASLGARVVKSDANPASGDQSGNDWLIEQADRLGLGVALVLHCDWYRGAGQYEGVDVGAIGPDGKPTMASWACEPYLDDLCRLLSSFTKRYASDTRIAHVSLYNEFTAGYDYSPWAQAGFRAFCAEQNPDLAWWNKRWGTAFKSIESLELPRPEDTTTFGLDYAVWRSVNFARFLNRCQAAVRAEHPVWPVSGVKLYHLYFSNHADLSRQSALDLSALFLAAPQGDTLALHEYGWGSMWAKSSKTLTLQAQGYRCVIPEWLNQATDDTADGISRVPASLQMAEWIKIAHNPELALMYQWAYAKPSAESHAKGFRRVAEILSQPLGAPLFDDLGVLDDRIAYYNEHWQTEQSFMLCYDTLAAHNLMPLTIWPDPVSTYIQGKPRFSMTPGQMVAPWEHGLLSAELVATYPGQVLVAEEPGKEAVEAAVARLRASEDFHPVIVSPRLAEGVYARVYRQGPDLQVAVWNSTELPARREYVLQPEGPAGPTYTCAVDVPAGRSLIALAQLAD
jgi:hypothetical protein